MVQKIINPSEEILIVSHDGLNGKYNPLRELEKLDGLKDYTHGRKPILGAEGDLIQVSETGEIILTHRNLLPVSKSEFRELRERGNAASLDEVIDMALEFRRKVPDERLVLVFEPRSFTTVNTIRDTEKKLRDNHLTAVFDSFFPFQLNRVSSEYQRSLHICGNYNGAKLTFGVPYDFLTVAYHISHGDIGEPVIYGAVGSKEILQEVSENSNVLGIYQRFREGSGWLGAAKKFVTNFTTKRKK